MDRIIDSIMVNAPIRTVYNQWTQFEEFPNFMEHVESVTQLDDTHLHWRVCVGGKSFEWKSEITEQVPDERIAWRSTSGYKHAGTIEFRRVEDCKTEVIVVMAYDTQSALERIGDVLGVTKRQLSIDLERFKRFVEARGVETGGWRGEIHQRHPGAGAGH